MIVFRAIKNLYPNVEIKGFIKVGLDFNNHRCPFFFESQKGEKTVEEDYAANVYGCDGYDNNAYNRMEEELLPLSECWYYSFTSSDYGIGFTYLSSVKEFINFLGYERRELINDEINDKDGIEEHIEENWRDQYSFDDGITDFKNALKKLSEDLSNLELNEKDLEDVMWFLKYYGYIIEKDTE